MSLQEFVNRFESNHRRGEILSNSLHVRLASFKTNAMMLIVLLNNGLVISSNFSSVM